MGKEQAREYAKSNFVKYVILSNGNIHYFWNIYNDLIEKTYQDLEKLIRCLEIYLSDCIGKIQLTRCSPDIEKIKVDSVLSFNYTKIPTDFYPSLSIRTHYIHGCADSNRPAKDNNMVLGVNEYWEESEKSFHTNFNAYKNLFSGL